jgi:TonB family protein
MSGFEGRSTLKKTCVGWGLLLFAAVLGAQEAIVVRIPEAEAKKSIATKTDPEYPAIARQMHLTGRVVVDIYVDGEGKVEKVQPVSGNQLLTSAAVSAVKKWKFNPFPSAAGTGKKAVTSMAFDFKL